MKASTTCSIMATTTADEIDTSPTPPKQAPLPSPCSIMDNLDVGCTSYEYEQERDADSSEAMMVSVHDLIGLTHLDEPAILNALRLRYDAAIIYTSTGPILIAINPFQKMDHLYSSEVMERYRLQGEGGMATRLLSSSSSSTSRNKNGSDKNVTKNGEKLSPHAYKTADDAYRAMKRGLENTVLMSSSSNKNKQSDNRTPTNQSILVSGESGAGKTVTTKIVLNYFAMLSRQIAKEEEQVRSNRTLMKPTTNKEGDTKSNAAGIEQQVLQSNPILEAFGNARTLRNDNSSRFGKYIDIRFTSTGKLSGAKIDTYLLEKVRLIRPSTGERNYHIFYQFLEAATPEEKSYLGLDGLGIDNFRLLNCTGGTIDRRDGVVDGDMHKEMLDAMVTIGFKSETISSILRLITAILHCGNITFASEYQSNSSGSSDACYMEKTHSSITSARLLGVSWDDLANALTKRDIRAGNDVIQSPLDKVQSEKACEGLMKALYGAVFDFIVQRVNESMSRQNNSSFDDGEGIASIGVLDIFGFEIFLSNNFEQLCINYTNEALQQQFNKYVFKLEQEEYEREGINWKFITFPDNQDVLDLIDRKHTGMLALLDEQCIVPGSTDKKLARYLYAKCDKHSRFSATSAQRADFHFSIEHYAGPVEYSTGHWLEKNKDQLPVSSANLLMGSDFDLFAQIQTFIRTEDREGRGSVATKSVGAQFSTQLSQLRTRIDATVPHYIRCLKPNDAMVPDSFCPKMIVDQLRCGGVLEAVRVSRAGYPTRYPHDVFKARYYILGYGQASKDDRTMMKKGSEVEQLIGKIAFDIWEFDREAMMAKEGHETKSFYISNGVARPETTKEFNSLDFSSRCAVAGLQVGRTKVFLRREALDRIEALRAQKFGVSALAIQRNVRGVQARSYYKLFKRNIMHSAAVIQRAYRGYAERQFLAPAAIKVQAIARGSIIRMRLSGGSKNASTRLWVPYKEFEILQTELESVATERGELLVEKAVMQSQMESLEFNVAEIADARETDTSNLQNDLAEKALMQEELSTLKRKVSEISAAKDTSIVKLHQELASVRQQLADAEKSAKEQEQLNSKIPSLERELLESKAEDDRLTSAIKSMECSHAEALSHVEGKKESLRNKNQDLSLRVECLSSDLEHANERIGSLSIELDKAKKAACQEEEQLSSSISSLEAHLLDSKAEEVRLGSAIKSMESNHADSLEKLKSQLDEATKVASEEHEQFSAKISSLEAQLLESKADEDRLSSAITSMESNHTEALASVESQLDEAKKGACQEKVQLSSNISSLEAQLLESKAEEVRLDSAIKSMETSHADSLASAASKVDTAKKEGCKEKAQLSSKISSLEAQLLESKAEEDRLGSAIKSMETSHADALVSVGSQFDQAKKVDCQEKEQLSSKILSLEDQLLESKAEEDRLCSSIKSLENNHAEALKSSDSQLDEAKEAACQEKEQLSSKISSLEAELLVSKSEEDRLTSAMESLESNHAESLSEVEDQLDEAKKEKEQLGPMLSYLESQILQSKTEEDRLTSVMESMKCSHSEALARVEGEQKNLIKQNQELSQRIECLSSEVEHANKRMNSLSTELGQAKMSAFQKKAQHSSNISVIESELLESKKEKERLVNAVESLSTTHSDALKRAKSQKIAATEDMETLKQEISRRIQSQLDNSKETNSQESELHAAKISSLMKELMESKQNEGRQAEIISMLKKEYEEYQAEQMSSGESKLEDHTLHDMIFMIQNQCADIIAKSKTMARELESSHGLRVLSKEASEFQLEDAGMLRALDRFTNSVVQIAVGGVVRKLLISSHRIENANAEMNIEVSLL